MKWRDKVLGALACVCLPADALIIGTELSNPADDARQQAARDHSAVDPAEASARANCQPPLSVWKRDDGSIDLIQHGLERVPGCPLGPLPK